MVHRHFPFKRQIFKTAHGPKEQLPEFPPFLRGVRASHTVVCVFVFPGPNRFFPPSFQCRRRSHHPQPMRSTSSSGGPYASKNPFRSCFKRARGIFSSYVACTTLRNCRLYQAFFKIKFFSVVAYTGNVGVTVWSGLAVQNFPFWSAARNRGYTASGSCMLLGSMYDVAAETVSNLFSIRAESWLELQVVIKIGQSPSISPKIRMHS